MMGLAVVLAACASQPSPPFSRESRSIDPAPTASRTAAPPATGGPSIAAVAIDPGLLDVLPASVDDRPMQPTPETLADAAADPAIVRNVTALAAALVIDPPTGEFAYATVMRFVDGVMSDEFYRDWRDSFDEGACAQAGGVVGHAEIVIGGHETFVGSCAGGVRTYHAWLADRGVLVSVSSAGGLRLGERVVEGLRG
jgi:hypothetical protein